MGKKTVKTGRAFVWILLMLAVLPSSVFAYSATAQVDQTRISMGQTLRLRVVVDGGDGTVDTSAITDFTILSSATQTSRSYVNGTWKHEVSYIYHLSPKKTGTLEVPALAVKEDEKTVHTQAIQIRCEKTPQAGSNDAEPGFQARARLETTQAVPGQQIVYTLSLLAPKRFSGAQFSEPDFNGLDARALTKWTKHTRTVNNMTVGVNQIKYLVQAPGPGTYDIGPAVFVVQEPVAGTRRRGNDPLGSLFKDSFFNPARTRPVRVVSNALSLEVTPLPAYQGNVQFSGLVGTFTLAASLDKTRVPAGASATLSLVVQGRGNVMDMGTLMPDLDETQVKVYPDAPQEDISSTGLAGKKVFRTALVPRQPGVIDIPKVGLTFFDPEARTYKTITTQPLTLEVLPGTNTDFQAAQKSLGAESETAKDRPEDVPAAKAEVTIKNRDILDIREDISAIHPVVRLPLPWFVLWLMLPGAGFGLFALVLGRWRSAPDTRAQARKKAAALIQKAGAADPEDPVFLPALRSSLTALILARSGRQAENLTCAEASALLRDSGVDDTEAAQMVEMMQTLDQARFGGKPLDPAAAETHLKQIRAWAKALVFVLALSLPLAPSAARAAASATQFVDAVKDYKAGRFEQAAMGFEAIAAAGVDNPGLFYNTGNAWLRDNNLGRAILWYERALRLAPSDPDIQFNLAHARTRVTDQVDHPLTARDILFFWKGWVSLRRLQLAAVAGSCVFFLWAAGRMVQRRKVISGAGTVILVIVVLVTAAAFLEAARLDRDTRAVILSPEVQVRSGTQDTATPLFDLHAGTIVNVLEKKSNHIKISIARNKVGWVCLADAEII